jgi:hypothetical protein
VSQSELFEEKTKTKEKHQKSKSRARVPLSILKWSKILDQHPDLAKRTGPERIRIPLKG